MTTLDTARDARVLFLAPTRKDATTTEALLHRVGVPLTTCATFDALLDELVVGADAVIVPEEAMTPAHNARLAEMVQRQPAWSDLPILVLAYAGATSVATSEALRTLEPAAPEVQQRQIESQIEQYDRAREGPIAEEQEAAEDQPLKRQRDAESAQEFRPRLGRRRVVERHEVERQWLQEQRRPPTVGRHLPPIERQQLGGERQRQGDANLERGYERQTGGGEVADELAGRAESRTQDAHEVCAAR